MFGRPTLWLALLLTITGCVEHYEYNYLTDSATGPQDTVQADGLADLVPADQPQPTDGVGDLSPDLAAEVVADVADVPPVDVMDLIEPDINDVQPVDLIDILDEEVPCDPDCEGRECGDDGCGGSCWPGEEPECDDGNECTEDSCTDGLCGATDLDSGECASQDPCAVAEGTCQAGECVADLLPVVDVEDPEVCWCNADEDCDRYDTDLCDDTELACELEPDDGEHPHCVNVIVDAPDCDDGHDCTIDSCEPEEGCIHTAQDALCDDGNPCTEGTCGVNGCEQAPTDADCDDANACTVGDACSAGQCQAGGETLSCDDAVDCTAEGCDPDTGCTFTPDNTACDDGNPCTDDACDALEGCQYINNTAACDDNNLCTGDDTCDAGLCAGLPVVCNDDNECTDDSCDPLDGSCLFEAVSDADEQVCDDSDDVCTLDAGVCVGGECVAAAVDCDDGNPCTDDACTDAGCAYAPNTLACDDSDPCTVGDVCGGGACLPGVETAVDCLDYDHDGIANGNDSCPLAFDGNLLDLDGDSKPDACEPLTELAPKQRALNLAAGGLASGTRRTSEIVDIPLTNGIPDISARGYFPLDGDASQPFEDSDTGAQLIETTPTVGVFGDEGGAIYFDGEQSVIVFPVAQLGQTATVCLWARCDDGDSFAFGSLTAAGVGARFFFDADTATVGVKLQSSANDTFELTSEATFAAVFDGDWHHVCLQWNVDLGRGRLFLDGALSEAEAVKTGNPVLTKLPLINWHIGAFYSESVGAASEYLNGAMDELIAANRWLSPREIAIYVDSGAPYGTSYVPGAQHDFDDIRIFEPSESNQNPTVRRSRIIGVRPHSDTPCPQWVTPGLWPHREDLCGVVAYWPMGDRIESVVGDVDLVSPFDGGSLQPGRFGDYDGATVFYDGGAFSAQDLFQNDALSDEDLTIELWFFTSESDFTGGDILGAPSGAGWVTKLNVSDQGELTWSLSSNGTTVTLAGTTYPGHWTHGALTYDGQDAVLYVDGIEVDRKPLTGALLSTSQPFYVGAAADDGESSSRSIVDDVLVHAGAKSADYLFYRARPELPTVRFLSSTVIDAQDTPEGPVYPSRDYRLGWGGLTYRHVAPYLSSADQTTCYGLANRCLGLLGWWNFDERLGNIVPEWSSLHLHAGLKGAGTLEAGADVVALKLKNGGYLEVPYTPLMQTTTYTIEVLGVGSSGTLVARGKGGPDDRFNYRLAVQSAQQIRVEHEANDETNVATESGSGIFAPGDFRSVAGLFDGDMLAGYLGPVPVTSTETQVIPGDTQQPIWLGATMAISGSAVGTFDGALDNVRIWNRGLATDEFQLFPRFSASPGPFLGPEGTALDSDGDGILDDGDSSGIIGDNPCTGGNTESCDDNAPNDVNGDQADPDSDGIGSIIDNCPDVANPDQNDHNDDGLGNACDPVYLSDWDGDGLLGEEDVCPFAFDGLNEDFDQDSFPDACKPFTESYQSGQALWFIFGEPSNRRIANEVVELPLATGLLDASTRLYLPFDDQTTNNSAPSAAGAITLVNGSAIYSESMNGLNSALRLKNGACLEVPEPLTYPLAEFTAMGWVRTSDSATIVDNASGDSTAGFSLFYELGSLSFALGDGSGSCQGGMGMQPWQDSDWHHVAMVFRAGLVLLYVDGTLGLVVDCAESDDNVTTVADDGSAMTVGCDNQGYGSSTAHDIDELLVFDRPLSPLEVTGYVQMQRPFGSTMVPGAQADFDDVRVMEMPYDDDPAKEFVTRTRLIGIRPHSDSPCPFEPPASTLEDRDDLCAVNGYWPLDNFSGNEVAYEGDGPSPLTAEFSGQNPFLTFGRFGSPDGAMRFSNGNQALVVPSNEALSPGTESVSVEYWYRITDLTQGSVLFPVKRKGDLGVNGYQVAYSVATGKTSCEWFGGSGKTFVVSSANGYLDTHWHHVGCVLIRSETSTLGRIYIDGILDNEASVKPSLLTTLSNSEPLLIGSANNASDFSMELDEILVHSVAKSADYFFNRARPSVPHLRFMVNSSTTNKGTEDNPNYPLRGYEAKWGKAGETAMNPTVARPDSDEICFGLINDCFGYAGWWRFDNIDESVIIDSSSYHHHGQLSGAMQWRHINNQFGPTNNASPGSIAFASRPHLTRDLGTFETVFSPGLDINGALPSTMALFRRWGGDDSYAAALIGDGRLYFNRSANDGSTVNLYSQQNQWAKDQPYHAAFHAGDGSNTMAIDYEAGAATSPSPGGFGADGTTLYFGAADGTSSFFSGTFFEMRLMGRALAPAEYLRRVPTRVYISN